VKEKREINGREKSFEKHKKVIKMKLAVVVTIDYIHEKTNNYLNF
jgi:hypothetical protein